MKLGIMIVGEAPGAAEDEAGRPFVGAAGQLLTETLVRLGVSRGDVYITNVVKCRPPNNRDPMPDEVRTCADEFLKKQVRILGPGLVISLGRISAAELLGRPVSISREHGRIVDCEYAGVRFKLFLSYHPAAGLYGAEVKKQLEGDFRRLGSVLKLLPLR